MLIYLEGNEPFLAHLTIKQLKERYLAKNDGGELIVIDASQDKVNWADLQAVPLFAQTRLVVIKNLPDLVSADQESLAGYLTSLPKTTIAVLWDGSKPLPKNSSLRQMLAKSDKKLDVSLPTGSAMSKHLHSRATYHGLKIEPTTAQQLISEFGQDMWALENELAVLALGGQSSASKKQRVEPFALYRFVQSGNWPKARQALLQEYRSGAPIELIIGSVASALRKRPVTSERAMITDTLIDIDAGLKTGWLDEHSAVALLSADLPKSRKNRVEWEELWEESLGG